MQTNKFRYTYWVLVLGLFFLSTSCVEEYWPELDEGVEQFLIVDGKISNFSGPYTVKLSYTSSLADTTFIPSTSATVTIIDDQGNKEILSETEAGVYKTDPAGIQGIVGRSYKVSIELNDGKIYKSTFEELLKPVKVELIEQETEWQYARNVLETDQEGFQFYVSSEQSGSTQTYLSWEIEETIEYHSEYRIFFYYDGTIESKGESNFYGSRAMRRTDSLFYCWKTQILAERYNYSLEHLNIPEVKKQPLHFIPFSDDRLRFGYNILVKQYTISKAAYTYRKYLKEQNENQGDLFTTQPFQIKGNISNIQDPSEPVLGYFTVAGASVGPRIQVRANLGIKYEETICYASSDSDYIHNHIIRSTAADWPLYFTFYFFEFRDPPATLFAYVGQDCLDCTRHGGVAIEPDFWQEWYKNKDYE